VTDIWTVAAQESADAIFGLDRFGLVSTWTLGATRLLGYEAEEVIGHTSASLVVDELVEEHRTRVVRVLAGERIERLPFTARHKNGSSVPMSLTMTPLPDGEGACVVARDVTEQQFAQATLAESELRLREAQELSHVGLWAWDVAAGTMQLSDELYRIHGINPRAFDGTLDSYLELVHPQDRLAFQDDLRRALAGELVLEREHRILLSDASIGWVYARASIEYDGSQPVGLRGICQDITERKRAAESLAHQAMHDALTGLPNRSLFLDRLGRAVTALDLEQSHLAVIFIDLDNFKLVNDSLGHNIGDLLLTTVARRLLQVMRPGDTTARFGGDEFMILCDHLATEEDAVLIAERLLQIVAEPIDLHQGIDTVVTASAGIAIASSSDARPEDLIRYADVAMYRAKEAGRARYQIFDAGLHERAARKLTVVNELRRAVENDEFRLVYQPQVSFADGALLGVEALVRWQHPDRGLLSPAEFIDVAEQTQLIVPLGGWVMREACRQAALWTALGGSAATLKMCVNVSALQLSRPDLLDVVASALKTSGLNPASLCLEITESVLMTDVESCLHALLALKMLGVGIAVDDFGTGYSSLAYLSRFPIDVLKIDKGFVDPLGQGDRRAESIVRAIIDLSRALDVQSLAEGVETIEQVADLKAAGCEAAQGYYFARPGFSEDVTILVEEAAHRDVGVMGQH
jgi:diguanylate cyclase (GGDEF)-like protein/PAS domain S-box-containing protein